jgi:hypothetical protein
MLVSALYLAAAVAPTPTAQQIEAAIWNDLQLNAWIGNGNDLVTLNWYSGHGRHPPKLSITNLACTRVRQHQRCAFALIREANPLAGAQDRAEPDRLACGAEFGIDPEDDGEWQVVHKRSPRGGAHSRTSMRCHVVHNRQ